MTTVRELTGELSFNADTTGATRFDQAVNRSKSNLEQLNSVSLVPFVGTMTKAWGLVTGAATLGTAAATKRFIDLEKAYDGLETATEDTTGAIRGEIESILEDKLLKNLVDEIDLVRAAFQSAKEGADAIQINRFIRLASILATLTPDGDIGEFLKQLVTGDIQAILKSIGQLPLEVQEILKAGGVDPKKVGLIGRRGELERRLLGVQDKLEKRIAEQRERGLTTFDELGGVFEKLTLEIGERSLPAFKDLNDVLIPLIEDLTEFIKPEAPEVVEERQRRRREFLKEPIFEGVNEPIFNIDKLKGAESDDILKGIGGAVREFFTLRPEDRITLSPVQRTTPQTNDNRSEVKVDKIEIRVEGGENPRKTGENVAKELRRAMGQMSEQAKQSTIKRGGR